MSHSIVENEVEIAQGFKMWYPFTNIQFGSQSAFESQTSTGFTRSIQGVRALMR
jgi:hypothetical protein